MIVVTRSCWVRARLVSTPPTNSAGRNHRTSGLRLFLINHSLPRPNVARIPLPRWIQKTDFRTNCENFCLKIHSSKSPSFNEAQILRCNNFHQLSNVFGSPLSPDSICEKAISRGLIQSCEANADRTPTPSSGKTRPIFFTIAIFPTHLNDEFSLFIFIIN